MSRVRNWGSKYHESKNSSNEREAQYDEGTKNIVNLKVSINVHEQLECANGAQTVISYLINS